MSSSANVSGIVTLSNTNGGQIIIVSYTNDKGVSKSFTVHPGHNIQLFTVDTRPVVGNSIASDFLPNKTYDIALQRGTLQKHILYPPADGVSEVDMNDAFRSRLPETFDFVNKGLEIIWFSYANSGDKLTSYFVFPGSQIQVSSIASEEGALKVALKRGIVMKTMTYAAADSPIDVNAAFASPASLTDSVSYNPVNRGRDIIALSYFDVNDVNGMKKQVYVSPNDTDVSMISMGDSTHIVQRGEDERTFTLTSVRELVANAGEFDVNELYNKAWYASNAHLNAA